MRLSFILSVAIAASGVAQSTPPQTSSPQKISNDFLEHWREATVSLGQLSPEGKFVVVGSAVIVAMDEHRACILTAKHVIYDPSKGYLPTITYMRFAQNEPRDEADTGILVPLVSKGMNTWKSMEGSDLAVIPLPDLKNVPLIHAVFLKDFGTDNDIYQSAPVIVLGYPELLGPDFQTTPIARGGIIAWTDPNGKMDKPFLVDANVFNGNSGGPVFRIRNGIGRDGTIAFNVTPAFIGIVSKDAVEEAVVHAKGDNLTTVNPATQEVTTFTAKVLNIGGIGIIEPASKARKLVEDFFSPFQMKTPR